MGKFTHLKPFLSNTGNANLLRVGSYARFLASSARLMKFRNEMQTMMNSKKLIKTRNYYVPRQKELKGGIKNKKRKQEEMDYFQSLNQRAQQLNDSGSLDSLARLVNLSSKKDLIKRFNDANEKLEFIQRAKHVCRKAEIEENKERLNQILKLQNNKKTTITPKNPKPFYGNSMLPKQDLGKEKTAKSHGSFSLGNRIVYKFPESQKNTDEQQYVELSNKSKKRKLAKLSTRATLRSFKNLKSPRYSDYSNKRNFDGIPEETKSFSSGGYGPHTTTDYKKQIEDKLAVISNKMKHLQDYRTRHSEKCKYCAKSHAKTNIKHVMSNVKSDVVKPAANVSRLSNFSPSPKTKPKEERKLKIQQQDVDVDKYSPPLKKPISLQGYLNTSSTTRALDTSLPVFGLLMNQKELIMQSRPTKLTSIANSILTEKNKINKRMINVSIFRDDKEVPVLYDINEVIPAIVTKPKNIYKDYQKIYSKDNKEPIKPLNLLEEINSQLINDIDERRKTTTKHTKQDLKKTNMLIPPIFMGNMLNVDNAQYSTLDPSQMKIIYRKKHQKKNSDFDMRPGTQLKYETARTVQDYTDIEEDFVKRDEKGRNLKDQTARILPEKIKDDIDSTTTSYNNQDPKEIEKEMKNKIDYHIGQTDLNKGKYKHRNIDWNKMDESKQPSYNIWSPKKDPDFIPEEYNLKDLLLLEKRRQEYDQAMRDPQSWKEPSYSSKLSSLDKTKSDDYSESIPGKYEPLEGLVEAFSIKDLSELEEVNQNQEQNENQLKDVNPSQDQDLENRSHEQLEYYLARSNEEIDEAKEDDQFPPENSYSKSNETDSKQTTKSEIQAETITLSDYSNDKIESLKHGMDSLVKCNCSDWLDSTLSGTASKNKQFEPKPEEDYETKSIFTLDAVKAMQTLMRNQPELFYPDYITKCLNCNTTIKLDKNTKYYSDDVNSDYLRAKAMHSLSERTDVDSNVENDQESTDRSYKLEIMKLSDKVPTEFLTRLSGRRFNKRIVGLNPVVDGRDSEAISTKICKSPTECVKIIDGIEKTDDYSENFTYSKVKNFGSAWQKLDTRRLVTTSGPNKEKVKPKEEERKMVATDTDTARMLENVVAGETTFSDEIDIKVGDQKFTMTRTHQDDSAPATTTTRQEGIMKTIAKCECGLDLGPQSQSVAFGDAVAQNALKAGAKIKELDSKDESKSPNNKEQEKSAINGIKNDDELVTKILAASTSVVELNTIAQRLENAVTVIQDIFPPRSLTDSYVAFKDHTLDESLVDDYNDKSQFGLKMQTAVGEDMLSKYDDESIDRLYQNLMTYARQIKDSSSIGDEVSSLNPTCLNDAIICDDGNSDLSGEKTHATQNTSPSIATLMSKGPSQNEVPLTDCQKIIMMNDESDIIEETCQIAKDLIKETQDILKKMPISVSEAYKVLELLGPLNVKNADKSQELLEVALKDNASVKPVETLKESSKNYEELKPAIVKLDNIQLLKEELSKAQLTNAELPKQQIKESINTINKNVSKIHKSTEDNDWLFKDIQTMKTASNIYKDRAPPEWIKSEIPTSSSPQDLFEQQEKTVEEFWENYSKKVVDQMNNSKRPLMTIFDGNQHLSSHLTKSSDSTENIICDTFHKTPCLSVKSKDDEYKQYGQDYGELTWDYLLFPKVSKIKSKSESKTDSKKDEIMYDNNEWPISECEVPGYSNRPEVEKEKEELKLRQCQSEKILREMNNTDNTNIKHEEKPKGNPQTEKSDTKAKEGEEKLDLEHHHHYDHPLSIIRVVGNFFKGECKVCKKLSVMLNKENEDEGINRILEDIKRNQNPSSTSSKSACQLHEKKRKCSTFCYTTKIYQPSGKRDNKREVQVIMDRIKWKNSDNLLVRSITKLDLTSKKKYSTTPKPQIYNIGRDKSLLQTYETEEAKIEQPKMAKKCTNHNIKPYISPKKIDEVGVNKTYLLNNSEFKDYWTISLDEKPSLQLSGLNAHSICIKDDFDIASIKDFNITHRTKSLPKKLVHSSPKVTSEEVLIPKKVKPKKVEDKNVKGKTEQNKIVTEKVSPSSSKTPICRCISAILNNDEIAKAWLPKTEKQNSIPDNGIYSFLNPDWLPTKKTISKSNLERDSSKKNDIENIYFNSTVESTSQFVQDILETQKMPTISCVPKTEEPPKNTKTSDKKLMNMPINSDNCKLKTIKSCELNSKNTVGGIKKSKHNLKRKGSNFNAGKFIYNTTQKFYEEISKILCSTKQSKTKLVEKINKLNMKEHVCPTITKVKECKANIVSSKSDTVNISQLCKSENVLKSDLYDQLLPVECGKTLGDLFVESSNVEVFKPVSKTILVKCDLETRKHATDPKIIQDKIRRAILSLDKLISQDNTDFPESQSCPPKSCLEFMLRNYFENHTSDEKLDMHKVLQLVDLSLSSDKIIYGKPLLLNKESVYQLIEKTLMECLLKNNTMAARITLSTPQLIAPKTSLIVPETTCSPPSKMVVPFSLSGTRLNVSPSFINIKERIDTELKDIENLLIVSKLFEESNKSNENTDTYNNETSTSTQNQFLEALSQIMDNKKNCNGEAAKLASMRRKFSKTQKPTTPRQGKLRMGRGNVRERERATEMLKKCQL